MTIAFPMVIVNNSMIDAIQKTRPSERLKSCDDEVLLFTVVEFTVELHISIICVKSETCKINEFVICGNLRISHTCRCNDQGPHIMFIKKRKRKETTDYSQYKSKAYINNP